MPKEIIKNASKVPGDEAYHIEIRWSPDMYAQMATVKKTENFGTVAEVEGMFVDLDRRTMNELIRVLRRARDHTFGKNE